MLKTRIITAAVLLAVFLLALFVQPGYVWIVFIVSVTGAAGWEWAGLMRWTEIQRSLYTILPPAAFLLSLALMANTYSGSFDWISTVLLGLASFFWVVVAPLWLHCGWVAHRKAALGFILGLVLLTSSALALFIVRLLDPWFVVAVLAMVWIADTAAYFSGRAFGKHKLAPAISPGKTWEGVAGGVLFATLYGMTMKWFFSEHIPIPMLWLIILIPILTAYSIVGDLFESMLKRQIGLKDSSGLLPGHGGVLDRIDSVMAVLPLYVLLHLGFGRLVS